MEEFIKPVNPYASEKTIELYNYLQSVYGKYIISGQQMYAWQEYEEQVIFEKTGKCPAIKGFDFIGCTHNDNSQTDMAIRFHKESKGIVTFCWHWNAPKGVYSFYTEHTDFDVSKAVCEDTEEYKLIIKDIDIMCGQIKRLQDAGVVILFRPLHEAAGGWFWWGAKGKENYQKLWKILFDKVTYEYKFDNIIWIHNSENIEWTVDENTYDMCGVDIYRRDKIPSNRNEHYKMLCEMTPKTKMKVLSELDTLCDIDTLFDDGTNWLYWCVWWGGFAWSEGANSFEYLNKVYNHEKVITLDKLPWFDETCKLGYGAQMVLKKRKGR